MMMLIVTNLLFAIELYHWMAHVAVLTGIRMLPRQDLVKQRFYFLADFLCVLASYGVHGRAFPLILMQNAQHLFYFYTWDSNWATKRVISWSSLEWDRGRWNQIDLVSGTVFDILVHSMNVYFLAEMLSSENIVTSCIFTVVPFVLVFFNPRFAWASPTKMPGWVKERTRPLMDDQRQELKAMEEIAAKIIGVQS